jgi:hypothetical protein
MSSELLQQAYRLIREGNKPEAVRLLTPIVRAEPLNADAWWLLANALDNPDQKRKALEQVLKLRPNDDAAQRMYDRLQPTSSAPLKKQTVKTKSVATSAVPAPEFEEIETDGDIFESYDPMLDDSRPAARRSSRKSGGGGRGPVATCLAIIGGLTLLSCVACLVITALSAPTIQREIDGFMLTYTSEPALATFVSEFTTLVPQLDGIFDSIQLGTTPGAPQSAATPPAPPASSAPMPSDLVGRGTISKGETVTQTLDSSRDDAWTFSADAGERVIIQLTSNDSELDPQLYLYDDSRTLVAQNDDISSGDLNSIIDINLTDAGKYTIRVSKFSNGGAYTLTLN